MEKDVRCLAQRLRRAQPVAKNPKVAGVITAEIAPQPDVLYLLVENVLAQENALRTAEARIAELSEQVSALPILPPAPASSRGGLLSRVFGRTRGAG